MSGTFPIKIPKGSVRSTEKVAGLMISCDLKQKKEIKRDVMLIIVKKNSKTDLKLPQFRKRCPLSYKRVDLKGEAVGA